MNEEKEKYIQNVQQFDTISFAIDYARQIQQMQGKIEIDDMIECFVQIYNDSFRLGKLDALHRYVNVMFYEIDDIEGKET